MSLLLVFYCLWSGWCAAQWHEVVRQNDSHRDRHGWLDLVICWLFASVWPLCIAAVIVVWVIRRRVTP
jgi:hypothetical protein